MIYIKSIESNDKLDYTIDISCITKSIKSYEELDLKLKLMYRWPWNRKTNRYVMWFIYRLSIMCCGFSVRVFSLLAKNYFCMKTMLQKKVFFAGGRGRTAINKGSKSLSVEILGESWNFGYLSNTFLNGKYIHAFAISYALQILT